MDFTQFLFREHNILFPNIILPAGVVVEDAPPDGGLAAPAFTYQAKRFSFFSLKLTPSTASTSATCLRNKPRVTGNTFKVLHV
jgi:hypothetical protein